MMSIRFDESFENAFNDNEEKVVLCNPAGNMEAQSLACS